MTEHLTRPGAPLAYHPHDGRRTLCGRPTDAMVVAAGLPMCASCARIKARGPGGDADEVLVDLRHSGGGG